MQSIVELAQIYEGKPAAVLGGAPSLLTDIEKVPADAVLIAVNHHAFCIGLDTDYMVFWDDPMHFPLLENAVRKYHGTKVSALLWHTDVDMRGVDYWNGPCTDKIATWLACWMGCDPVLLCGMELYQGGTKYCHSGEPRKPIYDIPFDELMRRWGAGFRRCPGIERVRAVSGPLTDLFGKWEG